ncbi:MAG TPA: Acyl-CoA dehydrogenase C-terminal domain-containing protein, partial [Bacteroidales bacterium]|nr:Acyl-CoA dehydrogenase C-terminal domain-containing protein [Bacteroidales bacterium]
GRKLTPEERAEAKQYQKLADMFTPILKLMSSEYSNQNAYDSLQIHGGSGFMKDYPIERIFRDARITTIYEGTSQLQVVAAQRYVTNGSYLTQIREYEKIEVKPEYEQLKKILSEMTDQYQKAVEKVIEGDNEFIDFHARRLVEMAAHIIMSYLLLSDA